MVMRHMSDTQTPQGDLAVVEQFSYQLSDVLKNSPDGKAPELVILETLQDPGNLGTILRAGEGAGVTGIILDRGSAVFTARRSSVPRWARSTGYRLFTDDLHRTNQKSLRKESLCKSAFKGNITMKENYTGRLT